MATSAARDDRLTPNAKALLQVIRARCGAEASTSTTKFTLASIMSRSARTIRRYLGDLEQFGYITTEIRRNARGLHLGLVITITDAVKPFFDSPKGLASWLASTPGAIDLAFDNVLSAIHRVTNPSPKNQPNRFPSYKNRKAAGRSRWERPMAPS